MHLKPSSLISESAQTFSSKITFSKDGVKVDAKSILDLIALQAVEDSEIELQIDGKDEKAAAEVLKKIVEKELVASFKTPA